MQGADSTDDKGGKNGSQVRTNRATSSEESMKSALDKSSQANSEEEAEGYLLKIHSADENAQPLQTTNKDRLRTDIESNVGEIIISTAPIARPYSATATSNINDHLLNSIMEMKMAMNQLSQIVNHHITQSKATSISLRSEIIDSLTESHRKIDSHHEEAKTVAKELTTLPSCSI